jgi:hypothetical protein
MVEDDSKVVSFRLSNEEFKEAERIADFRTRVPSGQPAIPLKSVLYDRLGLVGKASTASTAPEVPFSLYK